MRSIKKIHKAEYRPVADLITYSPLPTRNLQMIDPFLFLNHHGPQKYRPNNNGLPFGPHPHRGMETITFILEGDIAHKDSGGHNSVIESGGVQWMTAGSGLIHAEVSSEKFKKEGGDLEILQLWLNLPASKKMTPPNYKGLQKQDIPVVKTENGIEVKVVSGDFSGTKGAFDTLTPVSLFLIDFPEDSEISVPVPQDLNIFFYVIKGDLQAGGKEIPALYLAEFNNDDNEIKVKALRKSTLLLGFAKPFNEPVVAQGPFVMNSQEEIHQAYQDYQDGKLGSWE